MKTANLVVVLVFATTGLFDRLSAQTNVAAGPPMSRMVQEKAAYLAEIQARLPRLEKLGEVPEHADELDWQAAQETTWWGKPLDPEKFWKGRVVWLDDSAAVAAAQHGRGYPPMPYVDSSLPHFKDEGDVEEHTGVVEGPTRVIHYSNKEAAFWNKFGRTHPRPPETLKREQLIVAQAILGIRRGFEKEGNLAHMTPDQLNGGEQLREKREIEAGYPPEAFSEDALLWTYILEMRRQYQELAHTAGATNDVSVQNFVLRLLVDTKYLTEPSDAEVLKLANAWKIAYLQRLRNEKVDESYISAYLKAWDLKPDEVFANVAISPQPTR